MRKFVLIIFFIVSCVCFQAESAPPPPSISPLPPPSISPLPPPPSPSYAVIQMVMSWPPTYCQTGTPCKAWSQIKQGFSLHGLWPADNTGWSLDNCQGPKFSTITQLNACLNTKENLITNLVKYWPSIRTDFQDNSFWKYQWNKHGVCSSSHICTNTYFEKAVDQSKKLDNLLEMLKKSGIEPHGTKLYTAAEIKSAVQKATGKTNNVYISCWRTTNNVINLREIFICLNQMAGNYVSCPASEELRGCGNPKQEGTIKFPPFPTAEQGQSGPIEDLGFIDLAVDNIPMLL